MLIYKLLLPDEWATLESTGRLDGSPLDLASGFVHCSSRSQVAATARRVFADEPQLVVLALDGDAFGPALRWEEGGDGTFPHVYAPLTLAPVVAVHPVGGAEDVEAVVQDHVAIVTGANHGIGAATARALARRGCDVVCTFLRVEDPVDPETPETYRVNRAGTADAVVEEIRGFGGRAVAVEADLSDPATAELLFDRAEAEFGPVDILVNNATGWVADTFKPEQEDRHGRTLRPVSALTWSQQFRVDAMAPALLIAEFARRHVGRGASWGRIVGLTSGGPQGFPEEVSYGAAKAAQENYTKSAAAELATWGITANMVHPPVTDTGWVNDAVREYVASSGTHLATPEEVAEVVVYLASDEAKLISGNVVDLR